MRRLLLLVAFFHTISQAADSARVEVNFGQTIGPMKMNQMALGQGGLSSEPMFGDRIGELRALRPKVIRLFIQEYFNLLPIPGRYNFSKRDPAVDAILATGAKPLMCICFKPRVLFPEIRQDLVEPNDYAAWQALIAALVTHYKERASGIQYWEVANEPDIGEDGGSPYRFQPLSYVRYYKNTADAILGADPAAHIGGPASAKEAIQNNMNRDDAGILEADKTLARRISAGICNERATPSASKRTSQNVQVILNGLLTYTPRFSLR